MPAKPNAGATVDVANKIIGVWEQNPELSVGKDVTLAGVKTLAAEIAALSSQVDRLNAEVTRVIDQRDDKARQLGGINTRGRSAIRGYFGPDSPEYEQAGGTRSSERKPRSSSGKNPERNKPA